MKAASFTIFLLSAVVYFSVIQACEIPTRFRRSHDKILKSRNSNFGEKVGIPLVADGDKRSFARIAGHETSDESSKAMLRELNDNSAPAAASKNNKDSSDDKEHNGKSSEEDGSGYENIGDDVGSGEEDEEDMESGKDKSQSGPRKQDEMSGDTDEIAQSSGEAADLSGDFPPTANQVFKLPKDVEVTLEEVDRIMLHKHKGYVKFAIRQRFKPEFKYKESPAYKILAGNVIHDVERALRAKGVVKEVLFREAKDVGGPPYHSKVLVYLKLKNASSKKLKKIVDYGIINGMISVPGSFTT